MQRPDVTTADLEDAMDDLLDALKSRMDKHGSGAFASRHEAFGVLTEEYLEAGEAIRLDGAARFGHELLDIGVTCLFELASDRARARPTDYS